VTARGGSFLLEGPYRTAASGSHGPLYVGSVDVPVSLLGDAAFSIEEDNTAAAVLGVMPQKSSISKVTVQSAGPGLGELLRRCGNDPPRTKGVPTEHI
jgi:hypothetical protein